MRRQGTIWFSAAVLVLGVAACKFSDPTSSLRGGPFAIHVTELVSSKSSYRPTLTATGTVSYADLAVAETLTVGVQVVDQQGNYLSFAAPTYSTASGTVSAMVPFPDTVHITIAGNTLWKAQMIGKAAGNTTAIVQAAGIADTITVKVQ